MKADGATYRKLQRSAWRKNVKRTGKARAQARQAKVEERRNKRRDERQKAQETNPEAAVHINVNGVWTLSPWPAFSSPPKLHRLTLYHNPVPGA